MRWPNQEVPPVKSEKELNTWAVKRAKELKRLADGLEKGILKRNRTTLCNRAMHIRATAEALVFGVHNWELDEDDRRWQAERREPKDPEG